MNDFNSEHFAVQVIAAGSFVDKPAYAAGRSYLVETATVRLNHAALNAWNDTRALDDRNCFENDDDWVNYMIRKAILLSSFEECLAKEVGFTPTKSESVTVKQVVSEVFTVVWIHEIQ